MFFFREIILEDQFLFQTMNKVSFLDEIFGRDDKVQAIGGTQKIYASHI